MEKRYVNINGIRTLCNVPDSFLEEGEEEPMKVIYVAGPYRGKTKIDRNINIETARAYGLALWQNGFAAITPHLNSIYMDDYISLTQEDYYAGDIAILRKCDGIFMIKGWKKSTGSIAEHKFAKDNKIPIFYKMEELKKWQK